MSELRFKCEISEIDKLIQRVGGMVVARGYGEGEMGSCSFNRDKVSVIQDE